MENFYKKGYNPIVESMNTNYLNTYSNPSITNSNVETTTQENVENNANNSTNNFNNINGLLNMLGGGNANLLQNLLSNGGGINGVNKNELLMSLLNNLNKTQTQNTKKTATIQNNDFSNLTSIEDYNFID